jgi:3-hydroxybutyryl-CoA dehydrogenase
MDEGDEGPMIERVGLVGAGLMGSGLAEVAARAGLDVIVREADQAAADRGLGRITASLDRGVRNGKLSEADRDAALGRVRVTTEYEALADREIVIEAALENEAVKADIFRNLDRVLASPEAIMASNTSSLPVTRLAVVTERPEHVVGIHFFSPVPIMRLAELVVTLRTAPEVAATAEAFVRERLDKHVIRSKDRSGFVVNALLVPYLVSAIRMLESGFTTAEDIDVGMVEGCNHPIGPLHLMDAIGLDTMLAVANSLYDEFREPLYAAPPLLARMVEAGMLGRKSGRGFFDYATKS